MPEKQAKDKTQTKQGEVKWWVWLVVGIIMLMVPGGAFASPIFIMIAIIMKVRKPKDKDKTSPHSPLLLINTQP